MTYAGLTIADKDILMQAKKYGMTEFKIYRLVEIPNIDAALAQIAEMESAEKPEHSELYNQTRDEIATWPEWKIKAVNILIAPDYIEPSRKPLTVKDVMLELWSKDTVAMAEDRINHGELFFYGDFIDPVLIVSDRRGSTENFDKAHDEALEREIAYLESAAEGEE